MQPSGPETASIPLEITDYHARTAPEDVDTIEISSAYPDFMIFGTYSLVGKEREYDAQVRKGTIEVIPVSTIFQPAYPGMLLPKLAKRDFPAAVLDIHYHPKDKTLLGVALSNAQIYFFRFVSRGDVLGRRVVTELLPLGYVSVGEIDQDGLMPLVTQFVWLPSIREVGRRDVSNTLTVSLAATLSSHEVKIIKTRIPGMKSTNDHRLARASFALPVLSEVIHTHDLEAWTVASLPVFDFDGTYQHIIFSGGDDSRLIASMVEQDTCSLLDTFLSSPPSHVWSDRRTHSAGVTSILPLPLPHRANDASSSPPLPTPLLTGSYDENLYLHTLAPHTHKPTLLTSLNLRGGVWRLKLMDTYTVRLPLPEHNNPVSRLMSLRQYQTHYIVLVSCMHAGIKIVRVSHDPSHADTEQQWKLAVEAVFTKGHETLVYCCDFWKEWIEEDSAGGLALAKKMVKTSRELGKYTVVSTSFYDRQICVWCWKDEVRRMGRALTS